MQLEHIRFFLKKGMIHPTLNDKIICICNSVFPTSELYEHLNSPTHFKKMRLVKYKMNDTCDCTYCGDSKAYYYYCECGVQLCFKCLLINRKCTNCMGTKWRRIRIGLPTIPEDEVLEI